VRCSVCASAFALNGLKLFYESVIAFAGVVIYVHHTVVHNVQLLLPPPGGIAIHRVCWLVGWLARSFVGVRVFVCSLTRFGAEYLEING